MNLVNPSFYVLSKYHNSIGVDNDINLSDDIKNEIDLLRYMYCNNYKSILPSSKNQNNTITNIKKAQDYLRNNFSLKKVYTLSDEKENHLKELTCSSDLNYFKNLFWYKCNVTKTNPLDLNIETENDLVNALGCTFAKFPVFNNDDCVIFTPYFQNIFISSNESQTADVSYVHEIAHTQMERKNITYNNVLQRELISTLLGLIYACDNCERYKLKSEEITTLKVICENFAKLNNSNENNIYFYSNLLAFKLFSIYYQSNRSEKVEMKYFIQKIFEGAISVDDMLENYEVDIQKSSTDNLIRCLSI